MAKSSIGYLLPSGDAYTAEHACMMLFYPDKPEYRQALFGALDYFATWLAWEKEPDKKGKDAARAWREAIEMTRGCLEMNTCETILSLLTEIRDNTGIYCCDVVDISDGDRFTDDVEDGVGDVPQNIIDAGYADDAADWDGFYDYKCMISHIMVDNMHEQCQRYLALIDQTGAGVVTVAALAALAGAILASGGLVLVGGIILAVAGVAGLYAAFTEIGEAGLPDLIDAVDEHHDELACAIYNADGPVAATEALKDKIDELFNVAQAALLKNLNLPAQLKALYGARYDQQDIAAIMADKGYDVLDYDCSCIPAEYTYFATFDSDDEHYNTFFPNSEWANFGTPAGGIYFHWALGWMNIRVAEITDGAGIVEGDDIEIVRITLDYWRADDISPPGVRITFDETDIPLVIDRGGVLEDVWTELVFQPGTPKLIDHNNPALKIRLNGGTGAHGFIDNVKIWFNTV